VAAPDAEAEPGRAEVLGRQAITSKKEDRMKQRFECSPTISCRSIAWLSA
jgi:hypothetical protein